MHHACRVAGARLVPPLTSRPIAGDWLGGSHSDWGLQGVAEAHALLLLHRCCLPVLIQSRLWLTHVLLVRQQVGEVGSCGRLPKLGSGTRARSQTSLRAQHMRHGSEEDWDKRQVVQPAAVSRDKIGMKQYLAFELHGQEVPQRCGLLNGQCRGAGPC